MSGITIAGYTTFTTVAAVNVTTAGTRVQLSGTSVPASHVHLAAKPGNTQYIYVGDSNVSSTRYSSRLGPGEEVDLPVSDLNKVYLDSDVNGEGVYPSYLV